MTKLHELRQYALHTDDVPKYLALTGSDAFKCRHDNECVSGLCIGNMYGYTEGTCAQARLPFGAACFYKESCGTEDDADRRCVGSRFGRRGVCVFGQSAKCEVSFMRA